MKFERIVEFSSAFDKRHPNPNKNYGIGAVKIWFVLKKGNKAVQFMFGTKWYLPETIEEYKKIGNKNKIPPCNLTEGKQLNGWDVGYHSPKPTYKGQSMQSDDCKYTGGKCYYDGSGLYAEEHEEILLREGSEGVWKFLEKEWNRYFGKEEKK